jgi:hypothetical protein
MADTVIFNIKNDVCCSLQLCCAIIQISSILLCSHHIRITFINNEVKLASNPPRSVLCHFPCRNVCRVIAKFHAAGVVFSEYISLCKTYNKADPILFGFSDRCDSVQNFASLSENTLACALISLRLNVLQRDTGFLQFLCVFFSAKIQAKHLKFTTDHVFHIRQNYHVYVINRIKVPLVDCRG